MNIDKTLHVMYQTTGAIVAVSRCAVVTNGSMHLEMQPSKKEEVIMTVLHFHQTTKKILPPSAIPACILWWTWNQKVSFWSLFCINQRAAAWFLNGPEAFLEILWCAQEQ